MDKIEMYSDKVFSTLFTTENDVKGRKALIELIKPLIYEVYKDGVEVGRAQVIAHLEKSVDDLSPTKYLI